MGLSPGPGMTLKGHNLMSPCTDAYANLLPINLFASKTVLMGFMATWFLAASPTRRSGQPKCVTPTFSLAPLVPRYVSNLGNKRVELFDMGAGASDPTADDNVQMASGEIRTLFMSASEQFVLQACINLKLRSSQLDFECHFNEAIEKKK
ncbi:hypothetical protein TEA_012501 [Camellia sinensis var. sinensis]|uniref:Uncharacterized protein n=1 Tax=Camellia sinensis var. sinensis TaxID=542762 RepID=A0A4S4E8V8_CAMSN|nr:hypothetical protein TEA_012501 [Camellia sinensis var. sinensis]